MGVCISVSCWYEIVSTSMFPKSLDLSSENFSDFIDRSFVFSMYNFRRN